MRNTFIRNEITSREVILVYANVLYKERLQAWRRKHEAKASMITPIKRTCIQVLMRASGFWR